MVQTEFQRPLFEDGDLEIRFDGQEIALYGTREGLRRLSNIIAELIERSSEAHAHLEDYELLTGASLRAVVGVFDRSDKRREGH